MTFSLFALWLTLTPLSCLGQTTLSIPSKISASVSSAESPVAFTIPQSSTALNLNVVLCTSTLPSPRFFVHNGTGIDPSTAETSGAELILCGGFALWNGTGPATLFAVADSGGSGDQTRLFQIGITTEESLFGVDTWPPLLGDTTSTQALIFSPPFQSIPLDEPTYPNYVLPLANISLSNASNVPSQALYVFQTSNISSALLKVNQSACGISHVPGDVLSFGHHPLTTTIVLRDYTDFRTQWVLEGLTPSTNYTAYVVTSNSTVSGPLYFATKSSSFNCTLVHSLPFCPSVTYAVPLPQPSDGATSYIADTIDPNITSSLFSSFNNFTTSLLLFACGRDIYSPLQSCASCQRAYRSWLCSVSLPRCGEFSPGGPTPQTTGQGPPLPIPAVTSNSSRTLSPPLVQNFTELLPCVEMCYEVARSCPSFLQWRCPTFDTNAGNSYGVGYIDSENPVQGKGVPGMPQDRFGNVWCNYP